MRLWTIAVVSGLSLIIAGSLSADEETRAAEILSKTFTINQKYRSMEGPYDDKKVTLLPDEPPQLVWITGYEAVMVGSDGQASMPQEFMCHSNLDFVNIRNHNTALGLGKNIAGRLFTLSQGQQVIAFPRGFGIPLFSNEPLRLITQVLNHNIDHPNVQVRHKVRIDFVRDADLKEPFKPLFQNGIYGLKSLTGSEAAFGVAEAQNAPHGASCLPGQHAPQAMDGSLYKDSSGNKFTGHWIVKPGREVDRTLVTPIMNLPFDTTVHYVAVHLHPFAESLELRDLTTDTTVVHMEAKNFSDRIGLDHVDSMSSVDGIPLYKDHEYELVSVYNNTSTIDQDSMASMFLYLFDKEFKKPAMAEAPTQSFAHAPSTEPTHTKE